jgi:hypothetical protein
MRVGSIVSIVLFVAACCTPALEFRHSDGPNTVMWGAQILAVGWSGVFAGIVAWYANPFWLAGLIFDLLRKPTPAAAAGVIAIAIACSTFAILGREMPADEGDVTKMAVVRLLPGCYVWLASLVAIPLAAAAARLK